MVATCVPREGRELTQHVAYRYLFKGLERTDRVRENHQLAKKVHSVCGPMMSGLRLALAYVRVAETLSLWNES